MSHIPHYDFIFRAILLSDPDTLNKTGTKVVYYVDNKVNSHNLLDSK